MAKNTNIKKTAKNIKRDFRHLKRNCTKHPGVLLVGAASSALALPLTFVSTRLIIKGVNIARNKFASRNDSPKLPDNNDFEDYTEDTTTDTTETTTDTANNNE